jgi:biopolymer transport protein TolQ
MFFQPVQTPDAPATIKLDLVEMFKNASSPVKVTIALLVFATALVWVIAILKYVQLARMRASANAFEKKARDAQSAEDLYVLVENGVDSPGGRVVQELQQRVSSGNLERLRAVADRAIVVERQRARSLLSPLSSIAAASPFIGLFGTVYGIMDAFMRISAAKNASLPVVAPAIGEALVTTAIGLAAAIPAVIFYNSVEKRVGDFISDLEANAAEWVSLIAESHEVVVPLQPKSQQPSSQQGGFPAGGAPRGYAR